MSRRRLLVARELLPSLIERAANRLLSARTSAELLEAMEIAKMAQAYARLIRASNESHADCVLLIKTAQLRFADEIDRGQAKGQIANREDTLRVGPVRRTSANGAAGIDEVVPHQRVAEWRQVREAGGLALVRDIIAKALAEDRAPTDAEILREAKKRLRQAENDELRAIARHCRSVDTGRSSSIHLGKCRKSTARCVPTKWHSIIQRCPRTN